VDPADAAVLDSGGVQACSLVALCGCAPEVEASVSHVATDGAGTVSMALKAECDDEDAEVAGVTIDTREPGGAWVEVTEVEVDDTGSDVLDDGSVEVVDDDMCVDTAFPAIVAFTDGRENNSADEHETAYEGDGIDTTFEDLLELEIHTVPTPIYTVGVGDDVDEAALRELATTSGGKYFKLRSYGGLEGALSSAASTLTGLIPICFTVPDCSHTEGQVTVEMKVKGEYKEVSYTFDLLDVCDDE